jgi:hypothetical protein
LKIRRTISKLAAIFLAFYMLILSGLYQSAWAAMISTESIINGDRSQSPRGYLKNLLAREEIQAALISQGIDPQEARDRIDYLSDGEICKYVDEIDQLPAGGFTVGVIPGFIIIFVLVLVDIFFNSPSAK